MMPRTPETEEDVVDLIVREMECRRRAGYPPHVVQAANYDVRESFGRNWEFVGCLGGLRWTQERGWE